jgi:cell division protein FtsL
MKALTLALLMVFVGFMVLQQQIRIAALEEQVQTHTRIEMNRVSNYGVKPVKFAAAN